MSRAGKKLIAAAKEAVAVARGEAMPARITTFVLGPGWSGRRRGRTGRIVGESLDEACWIVIFEGTKTRVSLHKSFVRIQRPRKRERRKREAG